jgi:lysophospholipid acyltransferase (LPLAT)-like uncharacterized protein
MKITHPLLTKSLGLFGATAIRALTATLDYRIVYEDPLVDPVHPRRPRHAIYLLWHEYLIFPLGVRGKRMTVLISQHRDGELITQVLRHLGFRTVRGSSTRGGVGALRQMLKIEDRGSRIEDRGLKMEGPKRSSILHPPSSLILTPDGPRGPRRRLAEGAIFLASRLQMPIVCMGFAFERPWRQKSWDRFAIPRPYSRARAVISPFIQMPPNLEVRNHKSEISSQKRDKPALTADLCPLTSDLEYWRLRVEHVLNDVTGEAEDWADSGRRRTNEMPMLRHQPAPQMTRPAA